MHRFANANDRLETALVENTQLRAELALRGGK